MNNPNSISIEPYGNIVCHLPLPSYFYPFHLLRPLHPFRLQSFHLELSFRDHSFYTATVW